MDEETIDSLRRYRRTTLQTIEAEKKKLAGIGQRLREKIQEAIDSLSEDGVDVADMNLDAAEQNHKKKRKSVAVLPRLPRGYWQLAVAKFLLEKSVIHFHVSEFVEWYGGSADDMARIRSGLTGKSSAVLVSAVGGARFSIREGVTQAMLNQVVRDKTAEGIVLHAEKSESADGHQGTAGDISGAAH